MSLLMDALRKAEQQKRMLGTQADADSGSLDLVPLNTEDNAPASAPAEPARPAEKPLEISSKPLPELPTRLEDLDEQFMSHAPARKPVPAREPAGRTEPQAAPRPQPSGVAGASVAPSIAPPTPQPHGVADKNETARESARNLFDAKQPAAKPNRSFAIAVGLISLVAVVGIGGYFWWELQPKGTMSLAARSPAPPAIPVPAAAPAMPPPAPAGPIALAPQPVAPTSAPTTPVSAVPPAPTSTPVAAPESAPPAAPTSKQAITPPRSESVAVTARESDAIPAADKPLRVSTAPMKLNPALEQAYQAFNNGDYERARGAWQKVLASDARNTDALHGLAAIALHDRQPEKAAELYQKALEVNPKDGLAISGFYALRTPTDSLQAESRLKTLLAEQPDSPYLNFALGNLYSRTTRWAEAQQAYFKAHTADPGNPDYLYNLAVSLDQLHQPRLAIQYYNRATAAARQQTPGFDPAQVETRLKVLQSESLH